MAYVADYSFAGCAFPGVGAGCSYAAPYVVAAPVAVAGNAAAAVRNVAAVCAVVAAARAALLAAYIVVANAAVLSFAVVAVAVGSAQPAFAVQHGVRAVLYLARGIAALVCSLAQLCLAFRNQACGPG